MKLDSRSKCDYKLKYKDTNYLLYGKEYRRLYRVGLRIFNIVSVIMKVTPLDDIALNHLLAGNIVQAKEIWNKKETVSSLLNLMACALIENDADSLAIKADTLFQKHSGEFCLAVNETIKLTSSQLIELFIELIKQDGTFELAKLMQVSGTSVEWRKIIGGGLVKPIIDEISLAISEAKSAKGSYANYCAGEKLMNSTKGPLSQLKGLLGVSDMQYQMIADKLATTILQCGINYYNASDDNEAANKAMDLQKYALDIAVGKMAKERCQENCNILKKIIANLPPKEVFAETKAITDELEKFCKLPNKIKHTLSLLNNTKQNLCSIKAKLGASNPFYLKLSTQVVANGLHNVIEEVNTAQNYDPRETVKQHLKSLGNRHSSLGLSLEGYDLDFNGEKARMYAQMRYEHVKDTLQSAWQVIKIMDSFDKDPDFITKRYTPNRETLVQLCRQCDISTSTSESLMKGFDSVNDATGGCLGGILGYILFGLGIMLIGAIISGIASLF